MTIRLILDPRARKDDTHTIRIKIVDGRKYRKKISTPLTIEKRFWNASKERVRNTYNNSRILNKELDALNVKMRKAIDKYSAKQFTHQQVVAYVTGKTDFDSVDGYIETVIKTSRSKPTYIDYRTAINSLKTHTGYTEGQKLLFYEVNFKLLSDFRLKSKEVGMRATSFNSYLRKIRAVMNDAYDKNYIFDKFKLNKRLWRHAKRKPIETSTPDQIFAGIEKIKNIYDFQAIGFWVLMFALRGMYPADVVNLSWSNLHGIKGSDALFHILHTRSKTAESSNEVLVIRIDYNIVDLLFAIKHSIIYTHLSSKPHVVPSLGDLLKIFDYDPSNEYVLHQNTWDTYKKKIKKLIGVSYNTARKTFDTIAMTLAVPDMTRRVLLGHAEPSMLKHYGDIQSERFQEQVEAAHRKVLKDFKINEIIDALTSKLDAINAPKWIDINSDKESVNDLRKFVDETIAGMDSKTKKGVKVNTGEPLRWTYWG